MINTGKINTRGNNFICIVVSSLFSYFTMIYDVIVTRLFQCVLFHVYFRNYSTDTYNTVNKASLIFFQNNLSTN